MVLFLLQGCHVKLQVNFFASWTDTTVALCAVDRRLRTCWNYWSGKQSCCCNISGNSAGSVEGGPHCALHINCCWQCPYCRVPSMETLSHKNTAIARTSHDSYRARGHGKRDTL